MNNVLVPIDGSESSLNAIKAGLSMIGDRGDVQLRIITVQAPIASGNVKRFISAEMLDEYYQDEGNKALAGARELLSDVTVPVTFEVVVGQVAESIVDYGKKHGCNHVIMGTRGLGRVSGLLLGSVATKVLSLIDVPVTLVK